VLGTGGTFETFTRIAPLLQKQARPGVNPYFETVLVAAVLKLLPPKQTHYSGVTRGAHCIMPIHHAGD
jgi:hypothetical protein